MFCHHFRDTTDEQKFMRNKFGVEEHLTMYIWLCNAFDMTH